jgi:2,5-diamino-6-(ribosylamino)-4(3H)-pyrimidinone 5'-phosphate reductase
MDRPYVICHMMPSVDGRLRTDRWPIPDEAHKEYDRKADSYQADAWMCGRVTMEEFARGRRRTSRTHQAAGRRAGRPAVHVARQAEAYAIALDPDGKLAWSQDEVEGDALVVVVGRGVPAAYLEELEGKGISYVIAGRNAGGIDLGQALRTLASSFGIRTLLLEGGGEINGSFLRAGLVDELSLLVTPVVDGAPGEPALFDAERGRKPRAALAKLRLLDAEPAAAGMVWLRYQVGGRRRLRPKGARRSARPARPKARRPATSTVARRGKRSRRQTVAASAI